MSAAMKKCTVEGHGRALWIGYNLDARLSVGWEKRCGFCGWWKKVVVFYMGEGSRSACQSADERIVLSAPFSGTV